MKITKTQLKQIIKEELEAIKEDDVSQQERPEWAHWATKHNVPNVWYDEFLHKINWTREQVDLIDGALERAYLTIIEELPLLPDEDLSDFEMDSEY